MVRKVWLEGERETLGLYLTGHPINAYLKELGKYTSCRLKDAQPTRRDQSLTISGLVIAARVMTTKRGTRIGLMTLDDRSGRMEVMLFSDALERYAELLEKDKILVISGQVSFDDFNGGLKMSAREVMDPEMRVKNTLVVCPFLYKNNKLMNISLNASIKYWSRTEREQCQLMYIISAAMREPV